MIIVHYRPLFSQCVSDYKQNHVACFKTVCTCKQVSYCIRHQCLILSIPTSAFNCHLSLWIWTPNCLIFKCWSRFSFTMKSSHTQHIWQWKITNWTGLWLLKTQQFIQGLLRHFEVIFTLFVISQYGLDTGDDYIVQPLSGISTRHLRE
jgi:hypothetical protein